MDTWIWVVIGVAVVLILLVLVALAFTRSCRHHLRERFGPEYDRAVGDAEHRRRAERELREREARRDELELKPLSEAARQRYSQQWTEMQAGFVDRPQVAVADADHLITDLMRERGYPVDDFETRAALVSVDHPAVVENYRTAHGIAARSIEGRTSTEDLRQAVICYRALFEEMLVKDVEPPSSDTAVPTEDDQPRSEAR